MAARKKTSKMIRTMASGLGISETGTVTTGRGRRTGTKTTAGVAVDGETALEAEAIGRARGKGEEMTEEGETGTKMMSSDIRKDQETTEATKIRKTTGMREVMGIRRIIEMKQTTGIKKEAGTREATVIRDIIVVAVVVY